MNANYLSFDEVKKLYPNEWVLLGNPEMRNTSVLGGLILYHGKNKKEVYNTGRDYTPDVDTVIVTFSGDVKPMRRIGTLRRLTKVSALAKK